MLYFLGANGEGAGDIPPYKECPLKLCMGSGLLLHSTFEPHRPAGAGKTHTMLGMDAEPGIYLQTLTDLFQAIEKTQDNMEYSVSMSYLEVSWLLCLSWINCRMGTILTACAELILRV